MNEKAVIAKYAQEAEAKAGGRAQIAQRLGVTPNAVTNWKHGHSLPSAVQLLRLIQYVKPLACVLVALGLAVPSHEVAAFDNALSHAQSGRLIHIVSTWRLACQVLRQMLDNLREINALGAQRLSFTR